MNIQELKQQEKELRERLEENKLAQREFNAKSFCEKKGFYIGDAIEWHYFSDSEYKRGVICGFYFDDDNEVEGYVCKLQNKNGKIGQKKIRAHRDMKMYLIKRNKKKPNE